MKTNLCLILIDIQMDYFSGGRMELHEPEAAAKNAAALLLHFRSSGLPIIHIRNEAVHPGAGFLVAGTPGTDFHPLAEPAPGETIITKHFPNSFRETSLLHELKSGNYRNLLISGMMTHNCVSSTVRAAWDYGFEITLIEDATATRFLETPSGIKIDATLVQNAHIASLTRFSEVTTTDDFIQEN